MVSCHTTQSHEHQAFQCVHKPTLFVLLVLIVANHLAKQGRILGAQLLRHCGCCGGEVGGGEGLAKVTVCELKLDVRGDSFLRERLDCRSGSDKLRAGPSRHGPFCTSFFLCLPTRRISPVSNLDFRRFLFALDFTRAQRPSSLRQAILATNQH